MGARGELQITKSFVGVAQGLEGAGAGCYPVEADRAGVVSFKNRFPVGKRTGADRIPLIIIVRGTPELSSVSPCHGENTQFSVFQDKAFAELLRAFHTAGNITECIIDGA